jgi:arylsulfatase A-like enzyme
MVRGAFSHIDLVPTLVDLMGRPMPGRFPGRSLVPSLKAGGSRTQNVFIQWNATLKYVESDFLKPEFQTDAIQRAIRTNTRTVVTPDGWKLCLSDADKHQLFDRNRDPGETINLFYKGAHRDVVRRLTAEILKWQRSIADTAAAVSA